MLLSTSIFLFFLFLSYALFLLLSRKSDARQAQLERRVAEALRDGTRPTDETIQISRDDLMSSNATINLDPLDTDAVLAERAERDERLTVGGVAIVGGHDNQLLRNRVIKAARVVAGDKSRPYEPRCTPVMAISREPAALTRSISDRTWCIGRLRPVPRVEGMMQ